MTSGKHPSRRQQRFHLKITIVIAVSVFGFGILGDMTFAEGKSDVAAIEGFLDHYFSTWSNKELVAYKNCFHPEATIVVLDRSNVPQTSLSRDTFIGTQEEAQRKSHVKMREVPLNKQITVAGTLGQATVRWKLFKGHHSATGVDLFTLVLTSGEWKILHLAVRND
jgi:hypothetical protein